MTETFDQNQDGFVDAVLIDSHNDGVADIFAADANEDGVFEAASVDANNDGVIDTVFTDSDLDGRIDFAAVDADQNGAFETLATDTNRDGQLDTLLRDVDGNGIADPVPDDRSLNDILLDQASVIGPASSTTGVNQLLLFLAEKTGQAAFGTPDSDGDGYDDTIDHSPQDPKVR